MFNLLTRRSPVVERLESLVAADRRAEELERRRAVLARLARLVAFDTRRAA